MPVPAPIPQPRPPVIVDRTRININNNTTTIVDVRPGVRVFIPAIPLGRDRGAFERARIDIIRERQRVIDQTAVVEAALAQQQPVDQVDLLAQLDRLQQINQILEARLNQVIETTSAFEPASTDPAIGDPTDGDPGTLESSSTRRVWPIRRRPMTFPNRFRARERDESLGTSGKPRHPPGLSAFAGNWLAGRRSVKLRSIPDLRRRPPHEPG